MICELCEVPVGDGWCGACCRQADQATYTIPVQDQIIRDAVKSALTAAAMKTAFMPGNLPRDPREAVHNALDAVDRAIRAIDPDEIIAALAKRQIKGMTCDSHTIPRGPEISGPDATQNGQHDGL
jgi:hypothetical protein